MRDELNRRLRTLDRLVERLHYPEDEPAVAALTAGAGGGRADAEPSD